MKRLLLILIIPLFIMADATARDLPEKSLAALPEAAANNAVAKITRDGKSYFYSFSGLGAGKTHADVMNKAWEYDVTAGQWSELPGLPDGKARLASIATGLEGKIYLFGGYTVGEDGTEVSTPEVYAFDPKNRTYRSLAPMPVPVDDSVALAYLDRYIYLVSGWHDTANVSNVQIYDTLENRWQMATDYPGAPVFGHAAGIAGNRMIIADGVKVTGEKDGRRQFGMSGDAYLGIIAPENPAEIFWEKILSHPGNPLYRMAATGSRKHDMVIFAGGSGNPYNYNGIGYNGVPSAPSDHVFAYDLSNSRWRVLGRKLPATMDHRGLLSHQGWFYIIGGMEAGQTVTQHVTGFAIPEIQER